MKYLLQTNKKKLIAFFLIDETILNLKQKLKLLDAFDGDIDKIISTDSSLLKEILRKKKNISIDYNYYFKLADNLIKKIYNQDTDIIFKLVTILDNDYPFINFYIGNRDIDFLPSPVIFYIGNLDLLKFNCKISIVGTRSPDLLSLNFVENLIETFKHKYRKIVTISGFAKGIDYKVHECSIISNVSTIGILGSGIDVVYPASNLYLYKKILELGTDNLLISEYPPGTKPLKNNFPFRNRLIALLGEILFLIQSGIPSGANITVNLARKLGKEILIFNPGNFKGYEGNIKFINSNSFNGFFYIDKDNIYVNKLCPVLEEEDRCSLFKNKFGFQLKKFNEFCNIYFGGFENNYYNNNIIKVYYLIFLNPYISFDMIIKKSGLKISKVLSALTVLESKKMIFKSIDNRYYPNYKKLKKIDWIREG